MTPSKIVCIGRNYVDHIQELGNEIPADMVVFLKPNSAITTELIAFQQEPIHYETELCFIMENNQFSAVGVGLDLTKRALQSTLKTQQLPWERAKAFNGSALFSDFIPLDSLGKSACEKWAFQLSINEKVIQVGHSDLMMYSTSAIKQSLTEFISLEDGDIVMTGTPKGVGMVNAGDVFTIKLWAGKEYQDSHSIEAYMSNNTPLLTQQWLAK
ncbi:fumarylacetoacetate hydrolase family protein [Shewanella sp. 4_MG-2023]|uniref:fumarylacetoacetate hydrolase family protein n=1 Tax=Shewanella sp. 4_MG-2023 TaxID=3062652 RepID=UPI0026E336BA|nr:fumarylacetoacetate hydrolase family protein [Shewanella sp. 4_MG-2023]MDO6678402.1 fumarylacetoacetate hydrolase family protein [Shewanella sp. 4_MG-2023]